MTQNPSISFCLHFCWSPLLADLSIPNKISKYTCKKLICKMNGNLESPIGIPKWSSLYLKEWLKFYRLAHIRIGLIQKFANLFFRQNLMDASEFLHHWGQIFYCYMICIRFLCSNKLLWQQIRGINMITNTCLPSEFRHELKLIGCLLLFWGFGAELGWIGFATPDRRQEHQRR